jgi:hypothetical protein
MMMGGRHLAARAGHSLDKGPSGGRSARQAWRIGCEWSALEPAPGDRADRRSFQEMVVAVFSERAPQGFRGGVGAREGRSVSYRESRRQRRGRC